MSESKEEDDTMSLEERVAWLRERGVLVETPEERRVQAVTEIMNEPDASNGDVVTYVLVPCDTSKPLQELSFLACGRRSKSIAGDELVEYLKPVFGGNSDKIDLNLLQKQGVVQLGSSSAPAKVSEEALQQVASHGSVETFTLVNGTPSNHFTSVVVYLDEVGMLKRLPLNTRANDYARRAGFNPPPQFYGDVFLGRVKTKPALTNVSFRLGADTALDAPWLQRATVENLEYQTQLNSITGRTEVQPANVGEDGSAKAEEGYSWTQTDEEVEVVVQLVEGATFKDVQVKYHPQSIEVKCRKEPLLSLRLFERIDPDGCTWTLDRDGGETKLVITMEKIETASWPRIKD